MYVYICHRCGCGICSNYLGVLRLHCAPAVYVFIEMLLTVGVPKDLSKALSIYEFACHKGSSGACNNAGLVWKTAETPGELGTYRPADLKQAEDYFLRACEGGHKNGCFNLSALYIQGVTKDMSKALSFSLKSCELGHPYGCANAARMYLLGDGVEANASRAEELKKKARNLLKS